MEASPDAGAALTGAPPRVRHVRTDARTSRPRSRRLPGAALALWSGPINVFDVSCSSPIVVI
jgi:hypothetical protein